jgi:phenylacetate-coenzyme A ligase PaaK-like adenylate-forming protein
MSQSFIGPLMTRTEALFGRPKEHWTTVDHMIYEMDDYFRNPVANSDEMRLKSIQESLHHHYENSKFYHQLCLEYKFDPKEVHTMQDLERIPMLPDTFFKEYPSEHPLDVYNWLKRISTVDVGVYDFRGKDLQEFLRWAEKRLEGLVNHSSGTTGHYSFMFRDKVTFQRFYFAAVKTLLSIPQTLDDDPHYVYPGSPNTFLTIGKWLGEGAKVFSPDHRHFLTDREISMTIARLMSTGHAKNFKEKLVLKALKKAMIKGEQQLLILLKKLDASQQQAIIISPPFQLYSLMMHMKQQGIELNLGETKSVVFTGGGWKIFEDRKVPVSEFAQLVHETLGIPEKYYVDVYGMSEMNGLGVSCEGGYKHLHPWIHPMILDDNEGVVGYGQWGRFAFLDPVAHSYPGFIITGDRVKLLRRCPICDREGAVLEADITRMAGAEGKGCANLMRGLMAEELTKVQGKKGAK